jgi:hypothetical protein
MYLIIAILAKAVYSTSSGWLWRWKNITNKVILKKKWDTM